MILLLLVVGGIVGLFGITLCWGVWMDSRQRSRTIRHIQSIENQKRLARRKGLLKRRRKATRRRAIRHELQRQQRKTK